MRERGAFIYRTVFRRGGRSGRISAVGLLPETVHRKPCRPLYQAVARIAQEIQVARIIVIVPYMRGQPGASHRDEVPCHVLATQRSRESENVGRNGCGPSPCPEIILGRPCSRFLHRADKIEQRHLTFRQVRKAGRPVVHLHVNVVVIVHTPRAIHIVMPHSLQVGRKVPRPGTGCQEIAPELEIKRLQTVIRRPGTVTRQPVGRGQRLFSATESGIQYKTATPEQGGIIREMTLKQCRVILF